MRASSAITPRFPLLTAAALRALGLALLSLGILAPPAAAQFPTDYIVNGWFEGGFTAVPNPDPRDGSSPDELPADWQRFETFSGSVEGSALFHRTDNGPSRPGSSSLGITRTDGGTSGDWTAVRQDLSVDASLCSDLALEMDVLVASHGLEAGGFVDPAFEWPVTVQLDYTTTGDASQIWRHGWYLDPPGDSVTGPVEDPGTGLIPVFEDTEIPAATWFRARFDLLSELPRLATLDRITVGGSGWNFEGAVDNVRLLCIPRALEINDRRFRVEADWRTAQGTSGRGRPVQLSNDSGYFWFFSPDNLEVQVKVLDACVPGFDRFWAFIAGVTNVEVSLRVTDTLADETKVYTNELGETFETVLDTDAFDTCDLEADRVCVDFGPPFLPGNVAGAPAGLAPDAVLFRQQGIAVSIHEFRIPNLGTVFNYARISGTSPPLRVSGMTFGDGNIVLIDDLTLGFDFRRIGFTPSRVTFDYTDFGGIENFSVNGSPSPAFAGELTAAPCPAGIACTFQEDGNGRGTATLDGPVRQLRIGGQTLFVDTVCAWR